MHRHFPAVEGKSVTVNRFVSQGKCQGDAEGGTLTLAAQRARVAGQTFAVASYVMARPRAVNTPRA